jgi:hypothetical protein
MHPLNLEESRNFGPDTGQAAVKWSGKINPGGSRPRPDTGQAAVKWSGKINPGGVSSRFHEEPKEVAIPGKTSTVHSQLRSEHIRAPEIDISTL